VYKDLIAKKEEAGRLVDDIIKILKNIVSHLAIDN
jgi:hypothetical protein